MYVARHSSATQDIVKRANDNHTKVCEQMDSPGTLHKQLQGLIRSSQGFDVVAVGSSKVSVRRRYVPYAPSLKFQSPKEQERADQYVGSRFYGEKLCSLTPLLVISFLSFI